MVLRWMGKAPAALLGGWQLPPFAAVLASWLSEAGSTSSARSANLVTDGLRLEGSWSDPAG